MTEETISSDEVTEIYCIRCNNYGKLNVPADVFCEDCEQLLCQSCLNHHETYRPDHFVVSDLSCLQFDTNYCSWHNDKLLKFFCKTCDVLSCVDCKKEKHQNCESVSHLTEVVDSLEENGCNEEWFFKAVQAATATIGQTVKDCVLHGPNIKQVVQEELKFKRDEINRTFDQLDVDIDTISLPDKHELQSNLRALKGLEQYIATYQSVCETKRTKKKGITFFIFQKTAKERIKKLSEDMKSLVPVYRAKVYGRMLSDLKPDKINDITCLENSYVKYQNHIPEDEMVEVRQSNSTVFRPFCVKLIRNVILELVCFIVPILLILEPVDEFQYRRISDLYISIGAGMLLSLLSKILLQFKCISVALSFCWTFVISKDINRSAVLSSCLTAVFAFGFAVVQKIGLFFSLLTLIFHGIVFWLYHVYMGRWYVKPLVHNGRYESSSENESFDAPRLIVILWWILCITLTYFCIIVISSLVMRFTEVKITNRTRFCSRGSKTPFSGLYQQMFDFIQKN